MSVNVNDKSGLVESFTPGYEGCGCGNRRYYTKAEIDEMFRNVLDPEQIEKIVKEVVDEYVTSEEFSQVIISIIGEDYYTKAQIDTILEGYATKAWTTGDTDSRISTAMASETARTEDVYAKKTDVPSLDGYATTGWVDSQNYLKDITITINGDEVHNNGSIIIEGGGGEPIDLSDYAKTTAVTEAIETAIASETARTESTYAKKTDIPSLEGYATENYVDAAITAATENLPSKNWVIGHTDLAMATETGRTESTYAKKTDLDGKVDTSAFTAYTATTKECCDYVKGEIDDLWGAIADITGSTPTPPVVACVIQATYNVTTTGDTYVLGRNSSYVVQMESDEGVVKTGSHALWQFETTGTHTINITYNSTKLENQLFVDSIGNWESSVPITKIVIPECIEEIGDSCFWQCRQLTNVTLPNDLEMIDDFAFHYCNNLTQITLPNKLRKIGTGAFEFTGLYSITIPETVDSIKPSAFQYCSNLEVVNILCSIDTTTELPGSTWFAMFDNCSSLRSFVGPNASSDNKMLITNDNKAIAFAPYGITGYTIPVGVVRVASHSFTGADGLKSVTFPNSVKSIGDSAFGGCTYIEELIFGSGLETIEAYAFSSSSHLDYMYSYSTVAPSIDTYTFYRYTGYGQHKILYYPDGSDYSSWLSKLSGWTGQVIPNN